MTAAGPKEIDYEDGLRLVPRLLAKGRVEAAARWASRLCDHHPDDSRAHNQAGLVRQVQRRPDQAARHFRRAVMLEPQAGELWANLGNAARRAADARFAVSQHRRAACCRPGNPDIRMALSLSLLTVGDYARGFAEYEHRPERPKLLQPFEAAGAQVWDGRTAPGRRLLLVAEQGAGDVVQFLRFAGLLAARGIEVTVACPPLLTRLVAGVAGVAATMPRRPSGPLAGFDGVELLMSLPFRLGCDEAVLAGAGRYLNPPPPRRKIPDNGRLRVGLCWTGSPAHPRNEPRRIPFAELGRVLTVPGAEFYSLQVGPGRTEIAAEPRLVDLADDIDDFADTAAMVDQMDLVVTIDTSIAHIAGALGKPVWTLLAHAADWRWGLEGHGTCWYPGMRLFRQSASGEWGDVIDRVVEELGVASIGHAAGRPIRVV